MGRTGRKAECGAVGSLEGEQVMYETSEILIFQDVSFGTQGSSYRFTVMHEGLDVSGQCSITQTQRLPGFKGLCYCLSSSQAGTDKETQVSA